MRSRYSVPFQLSMGADLAMHHPSDGLHRAFSLVGHSSELYEVWLQSFLPWNGVGDCIMVTAAGTGFGKGGVAHGMPTPGARFPPRGILHFQAQVHTRMSGSSALVPKAEGGQRNDAAV